MTTKDEPRRGRPEARKAGTGTEASAAKAADQREASELDAAEAPGPEPSGAAGTRDAPGAIDPDTVARLTRERDEYLESLKRERAAFLNYKRQAARDRENAATAATCQLLDRLLPFIDDVDRARAALEGVEDIESLKQGLQMILDRLAEALRSAGIEEIATDGEPFDPRFHEAVLQVEDAEHPAGTILETTHRGFRLGDRLIRAARVVVSRAPESHAPAAPEAGTEADDAGDGEER